MSPATGVVEFGPVPRPYAPARKTDELIRKELAVLYEFQQTDGIANHDHDILLFPFCGDRRGYALLPPGAEVHPERSESVLCDDDRLCGGHRFISYLRLKLSG